MARKPKARKPKARKGTRTKQRTMWCGHCEHSRASHWMRHAGHDRDGCRDCYACLRRWPRRPEQSARRQANRLTHARPIRAKWPNTCPYCGDRWNTGDLIAPYFDGETTRWAHADCAPLADINR